MRRAVVFSIEFGFSDAYGYHRLEYLDTQIHYYTRHTSHLSQSITRQETMLGRNIAQPGRLHGTFGTRGERQ
jgi:hypothetical protein